MDFGFQARGGTAPALTVGYGRPTRAGRPAAGDPCQYFKKKEEGGALLGLPKAPAFRSQGQGKGAARASTKAHSNHQPRGWGKRHAEGRRHGHGMGPMISMRLASRQALSDLMDLNLALKYDKMGRHGEATPQKGRSQPRVGLSARGGRRQEGQAAVTDSPLSSGRASSSFDRQVGPTSTRYSSPRERYNAKASNWYISSAVVDAPNLDEAGGPEKPACPKHIATERHNRRGDTNNARSVPLRAKAAAACKETLLISHSRYFDSNSGEGLPEERALPISSLANQFKAAPRARRVATKTVHHYAEAPAWKKGCGGTMQGVRSNDYDTPGSEGQQDVAVSIEKYEGRLQGRCSPCQETASQQSEKDQRMWSALKTSLLAGSERLTDQLLVGLRSGSTNNRDTPVCGSNHIGDMGVGVGTKARSYVCFKGTRDMEQLDLERSAMDRTMRPHRVASARLLETNQDSLSPSKVKHPRNFSASAARPRTRHSESIGSVWVGAGGTLECTGIRAELVPRSGDVQTGFSDDGDGVEVEGYSGFTSKAENRQQKGGLQLERKAQLGRFQWVTNDEGVANFLQRPPSRQKDAFPTHLADVIPYAAFQVEMPMADEEAKQHIEVTRKNAVEQARPPSRHKPPGKSLFLEVPETRRQVPPAFSPSQGAIDAGTESCSGLPSGMLPMDGADVEATTARDAPGTEFTLDRRHDNPDRDGFSVLQVQGPCPFRIEVTNSFVQPHPPTVPVGREAALVANRSATSKKGKGCPSDPSCGLFGPMIYDSGGLTSVAKQRAPINTTPNLAVASLGSPVHARGDAVGKGTCVMSFRMLGSRSTGGIALPGTGSTVSSSAQGEDSAIAGDFPSPPPRPTSNETRESEVKGRDGPTNGSAVRSAGEGIVEEGARRKADATGGSSAVAGRTDTSGLRVSTGAPGLNVSEWSLQSCDDADDEAFLDGPACTLGDSAATKHALLDTTLGQDFLSLFAPSSGRDDSSIISTFDAF